MCSLLFHQEPGLYVTDLISGLKPKERRRMTRDLFLYGESSLLICRFLKVESGQEMGEGRRKTVVNCSSALASFLSPLEQENDPNDSEDNRKYAE